MTVLKFLRTPPLVLSAHLSSAGHLLRQHRWLPCSAAARGAVFAGSTCSIARRQLPYSAPVVLYADSFRIAAGRTGIVRRQLPCRALVVLRVDSFRIAAGRIVRRQLPCRALVVLRVDSFRIAAGLPRADSFRIVRRSTARRQLPYRAPVVPRADSFRIAAGLLPSGFWVAPPSACARRFLLEFGSLSQFHTGGCYSFDCPASPENRRPSATGLLLRTHSAALLSPICTCSKRPRAGNAP